VRKGAGSRVRENVQGNHSCGSRTTWCLSVGCEDVEVMEMLMGQRFRNVAIWYKVSWWCIRRRSPVLDFPNISSLFLFVGSCVE
jgi:hypothetical protein